MLQWQKKITKVQQTATSTAWHQYFNNGKGEKNNSKNRSDNWPNLETLKMGRVDFFKTWNKNVFCQNRKVEPKGGGGGFKCFKCLKHNKNFGYGARKKWIKNDSITWGEQKYFSKMAFKKKKILPPFVIPTVQNLSMCQVPKKLSYTKKLPFKNKNDSWDWKLEACSWKCHTMCWNWAALGGKKSPKKRCFHKVSHSLFVGKKCKVQNEAKSIEWRQSY